MLSSSSTIKRLAIDLKDYLTFVIGHLSFINFLPSFRRSQRGGEDSAQLASLLNDNVFGKLADSFTSRTAKSINLSSSASAGDCGSRAVAVPARISRFLRRSSRLQISK